MREQVRLAIMFADIAGSTRLYELLGDTKAREVTSRCIALLTNITQANEGHVVKTIGDEVMCTFPSADTAAEAAVQMQEEVSSGADTLGTALQIRVGFHFGDVILEGDETKVDVFGDAVNTAARMAGQAKADQIMTTGETLSQIDEELAENARLVITTTVKGKAQPLEIYELTWGEEDDLTVMGGMPAPAAGAAQKKLQLTMRHGDKELKLGPNMGITLGRGKKTDMMVPDGMASRLHCKVEFRRDRFVVIDQSTNGTYVTSLTGESHYVHMDEHQITGKGVIGLGQKQELGSELGVVFELEEI
uniref:Putative Adenylate/guanylate cyclase n=1 Tax=Magnetococcus massalia (strain MO-1) TaxID=451514 RepID=A0A1S7LJQ7_MAGMO|nr:putative Adenylate/guanylate cyclase [Candidatus Magnetococcus massalia]